MPLTLILALLGVALVADLAYAQTTRRRGDINHIERGLGIIVILLLVLKTLETGLAGTCFTPQAVSLRVHLCFAVPTAAVLLLLFFSGLLAKTGSPGARKLHAWLNWPRGQGVLYWLGASVITGLIFTALSLRCGP